MKSLNQLARVNYIAHWMRTYGNDDRDQALRCWLALNYAQQAAWIEGARAVYDEVKNIH